MATKDPWIISTVNEFAKAFPVGTVIKAKDLGQWMIDQNGIDAPKSTNKKDPTWIKYLRDRASLRWQLNRYASSMAFVESSEFPPFEIHYIKDDTYQVCAVNDDIRKLMRDLLDKAKSGFAVKARKIDKLHNIAETQALPVAEVLRLERMKEDLSDTKRDLESTLGKAIRLLNRCDQDFLTMQAMANGGNDNG